MTSLQMIDRSRWTSHRANLSGTPSSPSEVTIHYILCHPPANVTSSSRWHLSHGENASFQGTDACDNAVKYGVTGGLWNFIFQWQTDLPEALTAGLEYIYIKSFYDRLCYNVSAFSPSDVEHYASKFAQPGGMRSGFDVSRVFHQDAKDNLRMLKDGKCKVPSMSLMGEKIFLAIIASQQNKQIYENTSSTLIPGSGHWCAEENPSGFVDAVLDRENEFVNDSQMIEPHDNMASRHAGLVHIYRTTEEYHTTSKKNMRTSVKSMG
ncbi:hypothetical protein SBOR_6719 [Sclerotinia borealis F-4128]|uniref:Uncharacterized protein n=1 Tax=Sclerotinia borealis (strain F-4128) TaxID=1432307 RepID=W9CAL9_SCLBF|nr:hypothetical protein SBOR_6719 [Sclerotinia borealis F-4128]